MDSNEDNTSQGKGWIFDSGSTVHVCSQKELFNSLVARKKGLSRWRMTRLARSSTLIQSRLQKEMDGVGSGGGPVCPRGTV